MSFETTTPVVQVKDEPNIALQETNATDVPILYPTASCGLLPQNESLPNRIAAKSIRW